MRQLILSIILILSTLIAQAVNPYRLQLLTTSDGLTNSTVKCMHIDSRGFLWIGTDDGLNRYDGYRVSLFEKTMGKPMELHTIDDLQEDGNGVMWIDSEFKYTLFDVNTQQIIPSTEDYLKHLGINIGKSKYKVKIDDMGALWILQQGKLMRYDFIKKNTETWNNSHFNIENTYLSLSKATKDMMLLSCRDGVWQFVRSSGKMTKMPLPVIMEHCDNILGTYVDTDHSVWIYSILNDCLCLYSSGGRVVREIIALPQSESRNNAIRDLMDDGNGNLWIATDHEGVFIYSKQTGKIATTINKSADAMPQLAHTKFTYEDNGLSSNNTTKLVKDLQGTIWIGHFKTGVSYAIPDNRFFGSKGQQYGDVNVLEYDNKGNLWIGTDGDGLYIEHPDGTYQKTSLPNITISSLEKDSDGTMWAGSYSEGLFHITSPQHYEQFCTRSGNFCTDRVWSLIDDGCGNLWCGSAIQPLVKFNKQTGKCKVVGVKKDENILATDFCLYKEGKLLITSTYGLIICDTKTDKCQRLVTNKRGTQEMRPKMTILESYDSKRDVLVMGHRRGISIFDMKRDTIYYIDDEAKEVTPSPKSIVKGSDGNFWIATSRGIEHLLLSRMKDGTLEWQIKNYSYRDGMQIPFFNQQAIAKDKDGNILIGSTKGYTVISTEVTDQQNYNKLIPFITNIYADDKRIDFADNSIELAHDAYNITIHYFTGNLNTLGSIRYAYKLEGMMNGWTHTEDNRITLVGLSPGNYKLLLKVEDDMNEDDAICTLNIRVNNPFYLTAWAFLVYFILLCCGAYLFWRYLRMAQLEKLKKQKDNLEKQKLVQITDMKLKFFTNISHDLRTPLTLIISPVDTIIRKLEQGETPSLLLPQLKNVHKNAQLLLDQVNSLLDFRRLDVGVETLQSSTSDIVAQLNSIYLSFCDYAEERGISLSFNCADNSYLMQYDKEKMNKIIYNLLSNAFKFTNKGGNIILSFSTDESIAKIEVSDTGKGICDEDKERIFQRFYQSWTNESSQTGSGIGLHIVNEYVSMHNGTISISDNTPQGSIFTITMPIVNAIEKKQDAETAVNVEAEQKGEGENAVPTILVVDDNNDIVTFISGNLAEQYNVLTANDGQNALDLLKYNNVSLIISDVMMPGIDGYELCRRVKSDICTSHIPVILLTARIADESRLEGLQLGADDYIAKPFNMDVLLLRIQKFMELTAKSHSEFQKKIDVSPSEITITPLDEQFIEKAVKIVEENMNNTDFTVEAFGKELAMSRSFLYKKLMAITGLGPAEFIRTIRLKRGKALLERSQMHISEIAYTVGFNSLKSFTMNFKAEFGVTPSEYRKTRELNG